MWDMPALRGGTRIKHDVTRTGRQGQAAKEIWMERRGVRVHTSQDRSRAGRMSGAGEQGRE